MSSHTGVYCRHIKPYNGGHLYRSIPFEQVRRNYLIIDAHWNIYKVTEINKNDAVITIRMCDESGNINPDAINEYMQFDII